MYSSHREEDAGLLAGRSPVLERALGIMPRLFVLTAPAGYGKTTAALEYAGRFKSHAVIDLERIENARAFLLTLLKALASASADRAYIQQAQLSLAAAEAVPPRLVDRILDMWREPGLPAAVVFDNAECLPPVLLPLLNQTLERRPGHRACIICSDGPIDLNLTAAAPAAETLTAGVDQLQFSAEHVRELFADTPLPGGQLDAVIHAVKGIPLAALLLRRLHGEGRLAEVLSRADQPPSPEGIDELLVDATVESLPAAQRRAIEFCACVPDATLGDVRTCLGAQAAEALRAADAALPLLRIDGTQVCVHPLLRRFLARTNPNIAEDLRGAAKAALRRHDREIAAARYIACGDREEAANILDDMLERGANAAVASVAASLDYEVLQRHPRWFAMTTLLRRSDVSPAQYLATIQSLRARIGQTGDELARLAIGTLETHQLLHCGLLEQAQERLSDLDAIVAELKGGGMLKALRAHVAARFVDTLRAALDIAEGNMERGERLLKRASFTLGQFPMMTLSAASDGWLPLGLSRGDLQMIRQHCARARESLTRSGLDGILVDLDANEAFAAWALGDEAAYEDAITRVDERSRVYRMHGFEHLLGSAGLQQHSDPIGVEPLRRLIIGYLFAAAGAQGEAGLQYAEQALAVAREMRQPLFVTLAAAAVRERGGEPGCTPGETLDIAPQLQTAFVERLR